MISFALSDEQRLLQQVLRQFAMATLRPQGRPCDETGAIPAALLQDAWDLGLIRQAIPPQYGGDGLERGQVTNVLVAEELAYGDLALALAVLSPALVVYPLLDYGTVWQQQTYLPRFCQATPYIATAAWMEPRIAFDVSDIRTTARCDGETYILDGHKSLVPMGQHADLLLIFARTGESGFAGVDGFLVERCTPGLSLGAPQKTLGLQALGCASLRLESCVVPASQRLSAARGGDFLRLVNTHRTALAALAVGLSRATMEYSVDYAKHRVAFGEPIGARQSIAFMLSSMAAEVNAMRWMAWKAAWELATGRDATRAAQLAKQYAATQTMTITDHGVQILGGHGYIRDHPVELWMRYGRCFGVVEGLATV
jgi:alkylation response protein AidB-like acyl-CoA dehydrogenase